jgi:hypothetical protein
MTELDLLTLDGLTQPIREWALDYGIPAKLIQSRLAKGWTVEQAITEPMPVSAGDKLPESKRIDRRAHLYTHDGRTLTIKEWAERTGISRSYLTKRLRLGMPIAEAIAPVPKQRTYTHAGETKTLPEWARHVGINYSTLRYRVRTQRLPLGEALAKKRHGNATAKPIVITLGDLRIDITVTRAGVGVVSKGAVGTGAGSVAQEISKLEFSE